jgi:hypothetical protein
VATDRHIPTVDRLVRLEGSGARKAKAGLPVLPPMLP